MSQDPDRPSAHACYAWRYHDVLSSVTCSSSYATRKDATLVSWMAQDQGASSVHLLMLQKTHGGQMSVTLTWKLCQLAVSRHVEAGERNDENSTSACE